MMKIEDAIKILDAIKLLSPLEQAANEAINALEKQLPKKPIKRQWSPSECPSCNADLSELVGDGYYKDWVTLKFCDCGQKLDWREEL